MQRSEGGFALLSADSQSWQGQCQGRLNRIPAPAMGTSAPADLPPNRPHGGRTWRTHFEFARIDICDSGFYPVVRQSCMCGLSHSYFIRAFKQITGMPPARPAQKGSCRQPDRQEVGWSRGAPGEACARACQIAAGARMSANRPPGDSITQPARAAVEPLSRSRSAAA